MAPKSIAFIALAVGLSILTANCAEALGDRSNGSKLRFQSRMLRLDPNADPRCLRGFRGSERRVCCAAGCAVCGVRGCGASGGANFCCGGRIWDSKRRCNKVGPPCVASFKFPSPDDPDPTCRTGIVKRGVCCPEGCGKCGGSNCRKRTPPGSITASCCRGRWERGRRRCDRVGAPCRLVRASPSASASPKADRSRWVTITESITGRPTPRHEACMAWFGGKGYLVGGRRIDPVEIFDPAEKTWTKGTGAGFLMHHMQCVGWGGKIWVVSSWTGGFPFERAVNEVWVYDISRDRWSTRPGMAEGRLRGGAAQILFDDKIWVVGGNRGGHGEHATTLGWVDYFDLRSETWSDSDLADLPEGRDHVQGAVVKGGMLCIAGGRDGGVAEFFTATITSTYCYMPRTNRWRRREDLPGDGRGGTMAVTTCDGDMMIAGGERLRGVASNQVDIFNGARWRTSTSLNRGRHGGGLAVSDCTTCGKIYAASGSGGRGGGPELDSTEMYLPDGVNFECRSF